MIRDMEIYRTLMDEYREREPDNQTDLDLSVRVLTSGFWPINQQAPLCTLPESVEQSFCHFEQFYLGKYNGRKITLNPELGYADVKALFYPNRSSKPVGMKINDQQDLESPQEGEMPGCSSFHPRQEQKILTVTTYQMCLLLCFNQHAKMTYEQLLDRTKIPDRHLKRCLQSLAMGKQSQRILCRMKGTGKDIVLNNEFCVNDGFNSKLTHIKIQMVYGSSEMESERKEMVDDDHKHEIEAAIIRVMKARKKLLHNDLVIEVTNQLKAHFVPNPVFIRQRVESLIEREYLERDKFDLNHYIYTA